MRYNVQFLPSDGRSPYFMEIVASSSEEALSIAKNVANSDEDGIHVKESEWQCDSCLYFNPTDNSGCHTHIACGIITIVLANRTRNMTRVKMS